jgi:acetyltransferase-like isoleucine patch superfamily enzyme
VDIGPITGRWDYSTLPPNVEIGSNCFIERRDSFDRFRSTRQPGLRLGNRVIIYTWTTFNVEPTGRLDIGDDSVLVGPVFMCAGDITIGRRVVLSYNVTIADSDFHPLDPEERRRDAIAHAPDGDRNQRERLVSRPVVVEDDAWIGIGAILLKGVRIGRGARVGAGSVVTGDVTPGAFVAGNPARVVASGGGA